MAVGDTILQERRPRRRDTLGAWVAALCAVGSAVWAYIEYVKGARTDWLALALAGVFWGAGFTVLLGFRGSFSFEEVQGPRPVPPPGEPADPVDLGLQSRRGLLALFGTAAASVLAVLLLPLRSCGEVSPESLQATAWRRGIRLLTPEGVPLRPADLAPGSAIPVVPESAPGDPNSAAVLVRLRTSETPHAYSRVCTHAGCAVSMFRREESQLVCPCHFSVFDAASGAVLSGPASQPLPELPLTADPNGFLIAAGGFNRPIGPLEG